MNAPRLWTVVGALLLAIVPIATAQTGSYIGGTGDAQIVCAVEETAGACAGGQEFDVPVDATTVDIEIKDNVTDPTGGLWEFRDADGVRLTSDGFCDSAEAPVPSSAAILEVYVDEAFATLDCGDPTAVGTTGKVVATFD